MRPPNLLFLFTDEQRYDTMGAYGNHRIRTPNLNRLAGESVVFDRAYVTQPVCTPSRSTLLTGLYPHTTGCTANNVPLPPDVRCLPEMLHDDYATAYHGKWHLGDEVFAQHGFQQWRSIEDMYRGYYSPRRDRSARSSYHHFLVENGFAPSEGNTFGRAETARLPERFSKPAFLAREATRFIRENRRQPFVLFVNFLEPHMPFFGPRDDEHDPDEVALPENFEAFPDASQPLMARMARLAYREYGHSGLPLKTEADWRRLIANYWGLCSLVDTYVGRILAALAECELTDETIVVYTSDHGDMMGSHGLLAKCVMFEEAVRVPLLMRLPGGSSPARYAHPVSQVDLVPTLLDLMGQPVPEHLQGFSLRESVEAAEPPPEEDVFIEWNGSNASGAGRILSRNPEQLPEPFASLGTRQELAASASAPVRTVITPDGWKLNWNAYGEHELYNLQQDPGETTNLAVRQGKRPLMRRLAERLRRWQKRTQDAVELPAL